MPFTQSLSADELRAVFRKEPGAHELVGVEVETAPLDRRTGRAVPYEGDRGLGEFLAAAQEKLNGTPLHEEGHLVGLVLADGGQVSLENGGAVEYSSPPVPGVADAVGRTRAVLGELAGIAAGLGFALVPGANFPFNTLDDVHWVPNARGDIMRHHFERLGPRAEFAREVMALTLSTQTTFDYLDEADLVEKLRMQAAVSTPATALFVNSPLEGGRFSGALSRRMQYFARFDPDRDRVMPPAIGNSVSVEGFVDWALTLPMVYRKRPDGHCEPAPDKPFSDLMRHGFDDGDLPTGKDWSVHLSQIYSDVRVRSTLEVRAVDGPPYNAFAAVPAFWTGLTYHAPSRDAAWELTRHATLPEHVAALDDIAVRGLRAEFAGRPVRDLAAELLDLSDRGLRARVQAGLEHEEAVGYLEPLREVLATGRTFAEQGLRAWDAFGHSPQRFVAEFGVRT